MRRAVLVAVLLLVAALPALPGALPARAGAAWSDGVVVVVYGNQYGTGWWVNKNYLVTAAHVVGWKNNVTVDLIRGKWVAKGTVVYTDTKHDIAIIRSDTGAPEWAYIFPVATHVEDLKQLYVIGYPFELVQLASGNIISASEDPRIAQGFAAWYNHNYHLIEFQAETDAGNSGGPVVYANGAVAGLVSFALTGKAGTLYFATDANAIRQALGNAGVQYTVMDPPNGLSAGLTSGGDVSPWSRPFVIAGVIISTIVSIVITIIYALYEG